MISNKELMTIKEQNARINEAKQFISSKDIEITKQEYINSEFSIRMVKSKGEDYNGTKQVIATCVASMVEQLIKNDIFSPDEMLTIIKMAIENLKK